MTQPLHIFPVAASLAADLAGARVDPNEAQKALAYLRSKRDAKLFFAYLRAIVNDGRAVIRSGQTLGYYRDLLAASERHLRGMDADEMAMSLGWAIRLLRYYRAVPDAEIARPSATSREPQRDAQPAQPPRDDIPASPHASSAAKQPIVAQPPTPPKPGNDRQGKVIKKEGAQWSIELDGGFIVKATLAKSISRPYEGDRVSVRITGKGDTGEIRKVLPS